MTAGSHCELFGTMNFHWNYLNPPIMDDLVQKLNLDEVKLEMEAYKLELKEFRMATPLILFTQAHRRRHLDPPQEFRQVVCEFNWPNDVTLEDVENFRQEYASHYKLYDCAMAIAQIRPGSFVITWFIPESIVNKLKAKVPRKILRKKSAVKLEVAGTCVYRLRKEVSLLAGNYY